jgi:hypothetical protein
VQSVLILGLLAAMNASLFALGSWFATRHHFALRAIGIVWCILWALQCGLTAFATISEDLTLRSPTLSDSIGALINATTAIASAVTVIRVLRPRPESEPPPTIHPKAVP